MPTVISCPSCSKQLKVPDELIGRSVKCPGCKETFTAKAASKSAPVEEEIVEKPRKKAAPPPEEEEDDAPRKPAKRRDDDADGDDEHARPGDLPDGGGNMAPHRGQLWMILGIVSAAGFVISVPTYIMGPIVWWLADKDLKEMDAGRMDPEGRQNTQIGKICGIIGTVELALCVLALCAVGLFMCIIPMMFAGGCGRLNAPKH